MRRRRTPRSAASRATTSSLVAERLASGADAAGRRRPRAAGRRAPAPAGRAVVERRSVHVADVAALAPADGYDRRVAQLRPAGRQQVRLAAPLAARRAGDRRPGRLDAGPARPRPFTDRADRAAGDLRRPGRDRHRERPAVPGAAGPHARAGALGGGADGAGRGDAGGQLDPRPGEVLARIVDHARRLSGADGGGASSSTTRPPTRSACARPQRPRRGAAGAAAGRPAAPGRGRRSGARRRPARPVQVPDVLEDGRLPGPRCARRCVAAPGYRALLAVPLLREDRVLGGAGRQPAAPRAPSRRRSSPCCRPSPASRRWPSTTPACSASWRRRAASWRRPAGTRASSWPP